MTDVIEIARSRRSRLVAEIARLDDFISMAETLLRLEEDSAGGRGWLTDMNGTGGAAADTACDREDVKAGDGADGPGANTEADPGSLDPSALDAGSPDPGSLDSVHDGRNLFAPRSAGNEDELVLGAEESARQAEEEAGLDAAIGQKLRQRRWMMGMTKRQLAEKLGVGVEEVQNFELGLAHIGTSRIWELASCLDVPTSYFFDDGAEPSTEAADTDGGRKQAPSPTREVALVRTA